MNTTRRPAASLASEQFDAETLALLEAVEVPLPEFASLNLDVAFGTPLEMYEPSVTPQEMARYAAAVGVSEPKQRLQLSEEAGAEVRARQAAARDILADDPAIAARVRERLVDVLLPYAARLRIAPPAVAPVPLAA